MAGFSLVHWIIVGIMVFAYAFPMHRALTRAGLSGAWAILCIVPILAIVPLWVLAFSDWRQDDDDAMGVFK